MELKQNRKRDKNNNNLFPVVKKNAPRKPRQTDLHEFKANLVYILVKSAKATLRDPVAVKTNKQTRGCWIKLTVKSVVSSFTAVKTF